jgi:hypothetical protein
MNTAAVCVALFSLMATEQGTQADVAMSAKAKAQALYGGHIREAKPGTEIETIYAIDTETLRLIRTHGETKAKFDAFVNANRLRCNTAAMLNSTEVWK